MGSTQWKNAEWDISAGARQLRGMGSKPLASQVVIEQRYLVRSAPTAYGRRREGSSESVVQGHVGRDLARRRRVCSSVCYSGGLRVSATLSCRRSSPEAWPRPRKGPPRKTPRPDGYVAASQGVRCARGPLSGRDPARGCGSTTRRRRGPSAEIVLERVCGQRLAGHCQWGPTPGPTVTGARAAAPSSAPSALSRPASATGR